MDVKSILKGIRNAHPACHGIGFVDLSTNMVLATDEADDLSQERWDELAAAATDLLTGENARLIETALFAKQDDRVHFAISLEGRYMCILIKSVDQPADGLVGLCTTAIDPTHFIADALAELSCIAAHD